MSPRFQTYSEFWPYYLSEHSKYWTKRFHFAGTLAGLAIAGYSIATGQWAGILLALATGYAPAWISHFFIEKNKPATFHHPFWSFISDFRMLYLWARGKV